MGRFHQSGQSGGRLSLTSTQPDGRGANRLRRTDCYSSEEEHDDRENQLCHEPDQASLILYYHDHPVFTHSVLGRYPGAARRSGMPLERRYDPPLSDQRARTAQIGAVVMAMIVATSGPLLQVHGTCGSSARRRGFFGASIRRRRTRGFQADFTAAENHRRASPREACSTIGSVRA